MDNIFEKAAIQKLRFNTASASLTVENLYDLPLTTSKTDKASLDTLYKTIAKDLRNEEVDSIVVPSSNSKTNELQLQFNIVKHVIEYKMSLNEKRKKRSERAKEINAIEQLIEKKKLEKLEEHDFDELSKKLDELKSLD